jgi:ATP-dependent helicase HrpA
VFLNARRVLEWANVADELRELLEREWDWKIPPLAKGKLAPYESIHRALLAGVPRQFGLWDRENKAYRSASGGFFAVFPGSGLFGGKRWEWAMAMELVETTRLWARRVARIDPEWVEQVAPHLCTSRFGEAHWDVGQGAVYGKETVLCGGLPIVAGRRVHYGRVDKSVARSVFLREGLLGGGLKRKTRFLERMESLREEITLIEQKLRRHGGLWSEEAVLRFLEERIPEDIATAAAFHRWREQNEDRLMMAVRDVVEEDLTYLDLDGFPDELRYGDESFTLYYHVAPGERDDGVTTGAHVDQLPKLPDWLPGWGVDGNLRERAEILLRSLPKDLRRQCQPIAQLAESFAELWRFAPKDGPIARRLAEHIAERTGAKVSDEDFDFAKLPPELVTKVWVCDDEGEELAMGEDVALLKLQLADRMRSRFEAVA